MRRGRITTGVLLWLVAAVAATAVGMTAVAAISTDIFGSVRTPLSESEVDQQLSSRPPTPTTTPPPTTTTTTAPPTPGTSAPAPPPAHRTTTTPGGTVISRCGPGGRVAMVQAVPVQGFQVEQDDNDDNTDDNDDGDDEVTVTFQSADREIEVRLRCVAGVPSATVAED